MLHLEILMNWRKAKRMHLRDAQIKSLRKDDEIAALELHIHMLKGLMHMHGMDIPPDASGIAVTPAPTLPADNAPSHMGQH